MKVFCTWQYLRWSLECPHPVCPYRCGWPTLSTLGSTRALCMPVLPASAPTCASAVCPAGFCTTTWESSTWRYCGYLPLNRRDISLGYTNTHWRTHICSQSDRVMNYHNCLSNLQSHLFKSNLLSPFVVLSLFPSCALHQLRKRCSPPLSLFGQLLWREFFYTAATNNPNFDRMEGNPICVQVGPLYHTVLVDHYFRSAKLALWLVGMKPTGVLCKSVCESDAKIDILYKGQQLVKDCGACFNWVL